MIVYAADIAREAGIVTETKGKETSYVTSGITYESIRWDRFNNYVNIDPDYYAVWKEGN